MDQPQQIALVDFLARTRELGLHQFSQTFPGAFAFSQGFHGYSDLRINLKLSAAEDDSAARRFLHIIDTYTAIADECARAVGAEILEVQGERIHVLIQSDALSEEAFRKLFEFYTALNASVYDKIAPALGEHWGGFSMAADFGPAVLVGSECGGGSLVSLGNVANAPAKRLDRKPIVESGHLALRRQICQAITGVSTNAEWIEVNLSEPEERISRFANTALNQRLITFATDILRRPVQGRNIILANAAYVGDPAHSSVSDPIRVQGHCLRADLDGFSQQVESAFKAGPEAVTRLVKRFHQIMGYMRAYVQSLGRPAVEMPWAGDCATVVLMPRATETYDDVRRYLPVSAAVKWHDQEATIGPDRVAWRQLLGSARWAVCVAGGDEEEGSNGVMLVANVASSRRTFRVLAGWAARRSNDGYQASGVRADDTVLHKVDYNEIDDLQKTAFRELDSRFRVAPLEKLRRSIAAETASLASSTVMQMPAIVRPIPAPRPHGNEI